MKEGAVEVVRGGVRIAEIADAGAVFGISRCCSISRTAPTCAPSPPPPSTWPTAARILRVDPITTLYVAVVLAQRLETVDSLRSRPGGNWRERMSPVTSFARPWRTSERTRAVRPAPLARQQKHTTIVSRLDEPEGMPPQKSRQRRR